MKFPNFYEAYIYRAKLFVILKDYQKAIEDFDIAILLNPKRGIGFLKPTYFLIFFIAYLGKADCHRFLGNYEEAVDLYFKINEMPDVNPNLSEN